MYLLYFQQQSKTGGQFIVSTRVEFGNSLLGESAKVEINQETGYFVFDFSCSLNVSIADPLILDEIAQTPIVGKKKNRIVFKNQSSNFTNYSMG